MSEDRHEEQERLAREQAASLGAAAALRPFVAALGRHWLLIIALTLLAGGGCIAWFQQKDPDYEAEAQILVSPLPEDSAAFVGLPILRSADDPGRLIETAADIIDSPEAARRAARALPGIDAAGASEAVDVAADESSNIVSVIAKQSDREEAAALANAYAEGSLEARGAALTPLYRKALRELRTQIAPITARRRRPQRGDPAQPRRAPGRRGLGHGSHARPDPACRAARQAAWPATHGDHRNRLRRRFRDRLPRGGADRPADPAPAQR